MIKITIANKNDQFVIADLLLESQLEPHTNEGEELTLSNSLSIVLSNMINPHFILCFWENDNLIGVCFHQTQSRFLTKSHPYIHKNYRGKGLCFKILSMDYAYCQKLQMSVMLMPSEKNERLIKSCLKAGYTIVGYLPKCWKYDGNMVGRVLLHRG